MFSSRTISKLKLFGRKYDFDAGGVLCSSQYWFGRLRLHIFYRGNTYGHIQEQPFDSWVLPLHSYVEEVRRKGAAIPNNEIANERPHLTFLSIVPAGRAFFQPASQARRILGRYADYCRHINDPFNTTTFLHPARVDVPCNAKPLCNSRPVVNIVWRCRSTSRRGHSKLQSKQGCRLYLKIDSDASTSILCEY